MAERIRGLSIGLDLDSSGMDRSISAIKRSFRDLNSGLKTNMNNFKYTEKSIDSYKTAIREMDKAMQGQKSNVNALKKELDALTQSGQSHTKKASQTRQEYNRQVDSLNMLGRQYENLTNDFKEFNREQQLANTKLGQASKLFGDMGPKFTSIGNQMKNIGSNMSMYVTAPIAAGFGLSVKKAADFEGQMSRVGAIAQSSKDELKSMSDQAVELGAKTSQSAQEVALGMEELASLGFNAKQIMGAMPGVISAAEASGADMATTAQVMASSINSFGLEAKDSGHVADILAMSANKTAADITYMGDALKYAGTPAKSLGVSMEDTSAAIGIMSNAGLEGSQAGTSLRAAFIRLAKPSENSQKAIDKLGISMSDSKGNFVGMGNLIGQFRDGLKGMGKEQKLAAMSTIVGTEAASGFLALVEAGPNKIDKLSNSLKNSDGASKKAADQMKDNLKGSLEQLGGAFESLGITIGNIIAPAFRGLADVMTGVVDKITSIPKPLQVALVVFGGIAAAIGPVVFGLGAFISVMGTAMTTLAPFLTAIKAANGLLPLLTSKFPLLGSAITFITGPIGITIAAIAGLGIAFTIAYKKSETFRNIVDKAMNGVKAAFERVKDVAKGFFQLFQGNGTEGVISLSKILPPSVVVGLTKFADVLKNVFTTMKNVVQGAVKVVVNAFNYVKKVVSGVIQLFQGNGTEGVITLSKLLPPGLVVGLTQFADGVKKNFFAVINALKSFALSIGKTLSTFWQQNGAMIKQALGNILGFVKSVFLGIFNFVKPIVAALGTAIKFVFQKVIVPVITFAMKSIWAIMKFIWPAVKLLVVSTWENIKNIIKAALNIIMGVIKVFAGLFTGNWKKMWEGIKQIFKGALTIVWNLVQLYFIGKIMKVAKLFIGLFKNVFKSGLGIIKKTFTTVLNAIWRFVKVIFNKLLGFFKLAIKGWKNIFSTGWNFIRNTFKNVTTSIYNFVRNIFVKLRNNLKNTMYNLRKMFSTIWLSIKKNTTGNVSKMWSSIKNTFTKLWAGTKSIMSKVRNSMSSIWKSIKSNTVNMASGLWKSVKKTFNNMKNGLKTIIDKIKGHISSMTGAVKRGVNALLKGVNKVGKNLGLPKIPTLHTGTTNTQENIVKNGKIAQGTMAVVGDKGKGNGKGGFRNEIIEYPNGKRVLTPNKDTTTFLPKGSKVYNGAQTQQMLPKFNLGTDIWGSVKGAGEWAKNKALDTGVKIAKTTKDIMKGLGDVMDYASNPGKLFSKIMSLIGFDGFKNMKGGFIGDFARGIFGKMKKAIVDMFKGGFESMMSFGGDSGYLDMSHGVNFGFMPSAAAAAKSGYPFPRAHMGLDIDYPQGTKVYSTTKGTATGSMGWGGGFGNHMSVIDGALQVIYGHLHKLAFKGTKEVKPGTFLGYSGGNPAVDGVGAGSSSGAHLHYEMRKNGVAFDPTNWIKENNGVLKGKSVSKSASAWATEIRKAAAATNTTITSADVSAIIAQIQRESGGNAGVTQGNIGDINNINGTPAQGLLQFVPSTFRAYALKGHTNIKSGYDQLLAFFNNSNWRRDNPGGRSGWGPSGRRRFATGGLINNAGWYNIAEGGYPEWVIPTDPKRRSEAMSMIAMAANQIQGNKTIGNKRPSQLGTLGGNDEAMIQMLQAQQQQIALLTQLVTSNQQIAEKDFQPTIKKQDFVYEVKEAVNIINRNTGRHKQFKPATL